jgi:hypothetical protein
MVISPRRSCWAASVLDARGLLAAITLAATPRMVLFSRRIIIDISRRCSSA